MLKLNNEIIVVFQPNDKSLYADRRRFAVGALSLHKYVGEHNANTAISRALKSEEDKVTVKLRKHGRIDFYFK